MFLPTNANCHDSIVSSGLSYTELELACYNLTLTIEIHFTLSVVLERRILELRHFRVTKVNNGTRCISAGMFQAASSAAGGRGDVQEPFHQPTRIQDEDICIQLSCAKTTFLPLTPFFACCKSMLGSRLPEMSVNILPTAGALGALSAAPASLGQELGHTVAHHFIVRARLICWGADVNYFTAGEL